MNSLNAIYVSRSIFYLRTLNLKLCIKLSEKVREESIHLVFLYLPPSSGRMYGYVENISVACRMHFASFPEVLQFSCDFILSSDINKKKKKETWQSRKAIYEHNEIFFSPLVFFSPLSWVESIKARTLDGVAETQFLQNFAPLRANFRPILFFRSIELRSTFPRTISMCPFKKHIKKSGSLLFPAV